MTLYTYQATPAYDPVSGQIAKGATFLAYALDDAARATPLATVDQAGASIVLVSNADGMLPVFQVDGHKTIVLVSGIYQIVVASLTGFVEDSSAAASSAAQAALSAADAASRAVQFLSLDDSSPTMRIWAPSTVEPTDADGALDGDYWMKLPT